MVGCGELTDTGHSPAPYPTPAAYPRQAPGTTHGFSPARHLRISRPQGNAPASVCEQRPGTEPGKTTKSVASGGFSRSTPPRYGTTGCDRCAEHHIAEVILAATGAAALLVLAGKPLEDGAFVVERRRRRRAFLDRGVGMCSAAVGRVDHDAVGGVFVDAHPEVRPHRFSGG